MYRGTHFARPPMARIRKQTSPKNLNIYDVLIEDSGATSDYFRISQLPEVFSAGKNSFLIGASPYLAPRSSIIIEIIDIDKNVVYSTPVNVTGEADARIISVEVYENIVPGSYKLIVMGQAETLKSGGTVPDAWKNKYNVRWMRDVKVEPKTRNSSPIRFIVPPYIAEIEENRYLIPSTSYAPVTESIDVMLRPRLESGILKGYTVVSTSGYAFDIRHKNALLSGSFSYTNNDTGITSSSNYALPLYDIINKWTAITDGYFVTVDNLKVETIELTNSLSYTFGQLDIISSSLEIRYEVITIAPVALQTGSFATMKIVDLEPHSGEVYKVQISYKPVADAGAYKIVSSTPVTVDELLVFSSVYGKQPAGYFYDDSSGNTAAYWYGNVLPTSSVSEYPIASTTSYEDPTFDTGSHLAFQFNSEKILDGVLPVVPLTGNIYSSSVAAYFWGSKFFFEVFESSEYTLTFDAFYTKISGSTTLSYDSGTLDVYLVRQTGSKIISNDYLGQKIATIDSLATTQQNFRKQEFNFTPATQVSGFVGLRFVAQGGFWHIGNVSIKPATEFSFNPDEATFVVPVVDYANKQLIFKVEFLDINHNSTQDYAESIPTYFSGSVNIGTGTGECGSVCVDVYAGDLGVGTPDYSGSFLGVHTFPDQTAPANPVTGWVVYSDTADNTLKAKNSSGTIRTLAIP